MLDTLILTESMTIRSTFDKETIPNRVLARKSFSAWPSVLFPVCQDAHSRTSLTNVSLQPSTGFGMVSLYAFTHSLKHDDTPEHAMKSSCS